MGEHEQVYFRVVRPVESVFSELTSKVRELLVVNEIRMFIHDARFELKLVDGNGISIVIPGYQRSTGTDSLPELAGKLQACFRVTAPVGLSFPVVIT